MSSEISDGELRLLLQSLPEDPVPDMPELQLPPRRAHALALPVWVLWSVGLGAAFVLSVGASAVWWLLHGGVGVIVGEMVAITVTGAAVAVRGLGFLDAMAVGTLITLLLSPLRARLAPRGR
jgi:riboflavin transporter FmnP